MRHKYKTIAAAACALLYFAWYAPGSPMIHAACAQSSMHAQPAPRTLSYQGVLSNMGGTKASGPHVVTVTLYGDANGTTTLWQSTMNTQVDSSGVFNLLLGAAGNALPSPAAMDRPIWLGVAVDGGTEMRPLSEVTASAYALNVVDNAITTAKLVDGAVTTAKIADSSITTAKLADGSVTWNKMGTDYIPYIRVNGAKVNTGQNSINFTGGEGLKVDYDSNSMSVIIRPDSGINLGTGNGKGANPLSASVVAFWNSGAMAGPAGTNNQVLHSDGGVSAPFWGSVVLSTDVSGTLGFANGGTNNIPQWAAVEAGFNAAGGTSSVVTGGTGNSATGNESFVGGGDNNSATDVESTIGGGTTNTVNSPDATIGGGSGNIIHNGAHKAFQTIAGGLSNTADGDDAAIAGGENNIVTGNESAIGGGRKNNVSNDGAVIAGGDTNAASGFGASVLGGSHNTASAQGALVGGGASNNAANNYSGIVAGISNQTNANEAFVGAGDNNNGSGVGAAIVAGTTNTASGTNSFIGGGSTNITSSDLTVVAGGWTNTASGSKSAVLGGDDNNARGDNSAIGGGDSNFVDNLHSSGQFAAISGGHGNLAGRLAFVGGGWENDATAQLIVIAPNFNTEGAATLGGSNLIISGQDQAVFGCLNLPSGHNHFTISGGALSLHGDDRILEVGSPTWDGNNWQRHNAFEVSYTGHSIVYHTNGSSLFPVLTPVYQGATYVESPVYAWGAFDHTGAAIGNANFGVTAVEDEFTAGNCTTPGTYLVTLAPADPHTGLPPDITECSVTVTVLNNKVDDFTKPPQLPPAPLAPTQMDPAMPVPDSVIRMVNGGSTTRTSTAASPTGPGPACAIAPETSCGYATASQIGITIAGTIYPRSFIIRTYQGQCQQTPLAFFFKVCHR